MLVAALGNTGYIGYPVALGVLGSAGLVKAVFYDVFGTVVTLLTLGVLVGSAFGESEERPSILREFLTFPPFIAVLVTLALKPVPVPAAVNDWLDLLAKLVVPLIMISLGLSLRPRAVGRSAVPLTVASVIKLLVLPLVALAVARLLLPGDPLAEQLVVLQAGMPTMMLALVFGVRFRLDVELIASAALVTTALAIVTIPLTQALVR
jgi:predicted permease